MKKRFISTMLCLAAIATGLSGCSGHPAPSSSGGSQPANSGNTPAGTSAPEEDGSKVPELPLAESVTLNVMAQADPSVSVNYGDMAYWKMVEEGTNVKAEWTVTKGEEFAQKKNLMFVSGEYSDVIFGGGITVDDEETYGVEQQILVPLDEYVNADYMPNYYSLLESRPNFQKQITATDGKTYSISRAWEIGYDSGGHIFLNKQWLDHLGLEIPKTTDELEAVLTAFKTDDPNGNGQNDEIPMEVVLNADGSCAVTNLFGLFGQLDVPGHLVLEDDKVVFSAAQEGFRTGLQWVSELYNAGLIDTEAFSHDMSTYYAKIKGGNVGCFIGWRLTGMAHSFEGMEDQFVCIEPPAGNGASPVWYKTEASAMVGGAAITTANKHVAETIRWIDFQMNPDIAFQARQGVLGQYQEVSGDRKFVSMKKPDGSAYTNEEINAQCPGPGGLFFLTSDVIKEKYDLQPLHLEKYPYCDLYRPYLCEQSPDLISRGRLSQEDRDTKSRLKTDIDKFVDESTIQFISKGVTDTGWNSYLDTLNKMGLEEYLALNQKSYDAFNR